MLTGTACSFVTCFQTITFSNDLKLAHYLKVGKLL